MKLIHKENGVITESLEAYRHRGRNTIQLYHAETDAARGCALWVEVDRVGAARLRHVLIGYAEEAAASGTGCVAKLRHEIEPAPGYRLTVRDVGARVETSFFMDVAEADVFGAALEAMISTGIID